MSDPKKFYLTTPIYYVNARPHIGHAYTTVVADVLARRHRLLGDDTFFLTGTDEHGQKIERSAAAAGIPPQQFTDEVSAQFRALWDRMGLLNDSLSKDDPLFHRRFIRTTDPCHKQGAQKLFTELYNRGYIYLSTYTGAYCVSDEAFVDLPVGTPCPDCGRLLEEVTEENFFFKLSEFQEKLLDLIESDELLITPESARNEVMSFIRGNFTQIVSETEEAKVLARDGRLTHDGRLMLDDVLEIGRSKGLIKFTKENTPYAPGALKDLSVSRSSFIWGIPVPEVVQKAAGTQQNHIIYVWLDALANYMTAVGYGSDEEKDKAEFARYWPADLHLVGKEITRFHCVYWPAFLLALNPEFAHPAPGAVILSAAKNPGIPPGMAQHQEASTTAAEEWEKTKAWAAQMLPKQITANGWLLFDNAKMSKSRGNVVRTETILEAFGTLCPKQSVLKGTGFSPSVQNVEEAALAAEGPFREPTKHERDLFASDVLRYFLLREIPFGQDGSFSFDAMVTRYNADLANGYGNLVSRVLNMIQQYFSGEYQPLKTDYTFDFVHSPGTSKHLWIGFGDVDAFKRQLSLSPKLQARVDNQEPGGSLAGEIETAIYDGDFSLAMELFTEAVTVVDGYLTQNAPWKLAKQQVQRENLSEVLMNAAEAIRYITACVCDVLPFATARVWQQLGLRDIEEAARNGELKNLQWGGLKPGTKLGPLAPIFPRADKSLAQVMIDMENERTENRELKTDNSSRPDTPLKSAATPAPAAPVVNDPTHPAAPPRALDEPAGTLPVAGSTAVTTERVHTPHTEVPASGIFGAESAKMPANATPQITIDDFAKIELRVAQVIVAERIPKADKLLRLEVDLGYEKRQILSGIAEWYKAEDLIGRRIVVITNLAPRKMRGLESHGMLLAASESEGGKPVLATFGEDIALGSRLK